MNIVRNWGLQRRGRAAASSRGAYRRDQPASDTALVCVGPSLSDIQLHATETLCS